MGQHRDARQQADQSPAQTRRRKIIQHGDDCHRRARRTRQRVTRQAEKFHMTVDEDDGDQPRHRADESNPQHLRPPIAVRFIPDFWVVRRPKRDDHPQRDRARQPQSHPRFGQAQVEGQVVERHAPGEEYHVERILREARQPPQSRLKRGREQRAELQSHVRGVALAGEKEQPPDEEGERAEEEGEPGAEGGN